MNDKRGRPRAANSALFLGGHPLDALRRLEFSQRVLPMRRFWELYGSDLPLLAMVRVGFHGAHGFDVFSSSEILWVATSRIQRRVVARDLLQGSSRYVSMPLDYPMDVVPLSHTGQALGRPCRLQDVVSRHTLPVTVRVVAKSSFSFYMAADLETEITFTDLKLIETYDDRYLLVNSVVDSTIYWEPPNVLPVYLPVTISPVIGPRDVDDATWRQFNQQVQQLSTNCAYDKPPMNKDIMVFSESDIERHEGIYDYIEPSCLIKYQETIKIPRKVSGKLVDMKSFQKNVKKKGKSTKEYKLGERPKKPGEVSSQYVEHSERKLPPLPSSKDDSRMSHSYEDVKDGEYVSVGVKKEEPKYMSPPDAQAPTTQLMKELHAKIDRPDSKYEAIKRLDEAQHSYVTPKALKDTIETQLLVSSITSLSNVPRDISGLSVAEVIDCLKLLKLDMLVDGFKKQQVDGHLLQALEPDDVREEFGVSAFVAKKVCMFAKGEWRPESQA